MTELSIRPEEIRDALQRFVSDYKPETATKEEVGTVAEAADGIAQVTGLPSVMANELLEAKIERVLTNDPGMGVIRHVDAGYDRAEEVARERGVRIPMAEG